MVHMLASYRVTRGPCQNTVCMMLMLKLCSEAVEWSTYSIWLLLRYFKRTKSNLSPGTQDNRCQLKNNTTSDV